MHLPECFLPGELVCRIDIVDKNDHPRFGEEKYSARVSEDVDVHSRVLELKAMYTNTGILLIMLSM